MKKILLAVCITIIMGNTIYGKYKNTYVNPYGKNAKQNKNEKVLDMGTINISGGDNQVNIREVANSIEILTEQDIEDSGATGILDILDTIPGIKVSKGFGNGKVDIRGQGDTAASNVLIMVDGRKLNTIDMSGPNLNKIPIDIVKRIEVMSSGGTVLYGDGAVGGVINIVTKSNMQQASDTSLKVELGSQNSMDMALNYNKKSENKFLNFSAIKEKSDGYRENSDKDNLNLNIAYGFENPNNYKMKFDFNYNDLEMGLPGSLNLEQLEEDREQSFKLNDDVQSKEKMYRISYEKLVGINTLLTMDYSKTSSDTESYYDGSGERKDEIEQDEFSSKLIKNYMQKRMKVIAGYNYTKGESKVESEFQNYKKMKKSNSIFLMNKYFGERLQANQGMRYEMIDYNDEDYVETAYEISFNYLYSSTGNIYFNNNSGYRAPKIDELSWADDDLEPQTHTIYEIGLRDYGFGTFYNIAVYQSKAAGEIYYDPMENVNKNIDGKTKRIGIEIKGKQIYSKFIFTESFAYIDHSIEDGAYKDKDIPGVADKTAGLGMKYIINDEFDFNVNYRYNGKAYAFSDFANEMDKEESYSITDIKLNCNWNENLKIYSGINNIFDEEYNEYTGYSSWSGKYYYPASGRYYYAGFKYKF